MMISFEAMKEDRLLTDIFHRPFSLRKLKWVWSKWQETLYGRGWNCLYIENHDHPRSISRFGSETYRTESGKSLACAYLFQQGTPIVYQGQEIGMTNIRLRSIHEYEDVQTHHIYDTCPRRMSAEKRLQRVWDTSRESSRTPMQWNGGKNAGFTAGMPWFYVNPNYTEINVADQEDDPDSLLNFYRDAIELRRTLPVVRRGAYRQYEPLNENLYIYERRSKAERLLVICSFTDKSVKFTAPKEYELARGELLLWSHEENVEKNGFMTKPYECRVYYFRERRRRGREHVAPPKDDF